MIKFTHHIFSFVLFNLKLDSASLNNSMTAKYRSLFHKFTTVFNTHHFISLHVELGIFTHCCLYANWSEYDNLMITPWWNMTICSIRTAFLTFIFVNSSLVKLLGCESGNLFFSFSFVFCFLSVSFFALSFFFCKWIRISAFLIFDLLF